MKPTSISKRTIFLLPLLLCAATLAVFLNSQFSVARSIHADRVDEMGTLPPVEYSETDLALHPIYGHSIVDGGIHSAEEFLHAVRVDPEIAAHYKNFDLAEAHIISFQHPVHAYVSYRIAGEGIFWTRQPVTIAAHEQLITDGKMYIRTRCGNLMSETARTPTHNPSEPSDLNHVGGFPPISIPQDVSEYFPPPPIFTPPLPLTGPTLPPLFPTPYPPIESCTDCVIVAPPPPAPPNPPVSIPEPNSLVLLAAGIAALPLLESLATKFGPRSHAS
jgi:hypothetical protein